MTHSAAKIITPCEGATFDALGDAVRIILRADDTGGTLTLVEQRSLPGAGVPPHVNTREDEVFQVLEGRVEFQVGDHTTSAVPGTVVYVPKNVPHGFRVTGTEPARLQITIRPGGLEKMLEEIIRLPNPPDRREISAICERYGVQFLGH